MGSLSEARRTVKEGGAYLNNERVTDADAVPGDDAWLAGGWLVLRRGKRSIAGVQRTARLTGSAGVCPAGVGRVPAGVGRHRPTGLTPAPRRDVTFSLRRARPRRGPAGSPCGG